MKIKLGVIFGGESVEHEVSIINVPDPNAKKPWMDFSDIFYAEDIFTFRFPDSELASGRILQMEKLRTDVCDFVRETDAEMIVIRCQYDIDAIYARTVAMELPQWLFEMENK